MNTYTNSDGETLAFNKSLDFGYVLASEMHRLMEEHPELEFTLRVDAEQDGEEADVWYADSPEFWHWTEDQVPTDDFQRPLRLQAREK